MRILHVTPEAPGKTSGGRLGILQGSLALVSLPFEVDYIGPAIEDDALKQKYHHTYELQPNHSKLNLLDTLLHGQSNTSYRAFCNLKIDWKQYDVLYLDFTKQDYVVKEARKHNPNIRIICRVHNVEQDYANVVAEKNGGFKNRMVARFQPRQEKTILEESDRLLVLTQHDLQRLHELYDFSDEKVQIMPVCLEDTHPFHYHPMSEPMKILMTGSLWFGPNVDGINWVIDEVLPKLTIPVAVTAAGSHPNEAFQEKCRKHGIRIIDTPESMDPYFEECDLFCIPIFDGAGMKVKFAEALSYGKAIVSTHFGAIGYDVQNGVNCMIGDDAAQFLSAIMNYGLMGETERFEMARQARLLYEEKYSIQSCAKIITEILETIK